MSRDDSLPAIRCCADDERLVWIRAGVGRFKADRHQTVGVGHARKEWGIAPCPARKTSTARLASPACSGCGRAQGCAPGQGNWPCCRVQMFEPAHHDDARARAVIGRAGGEELKQPNRKITSGSRIRSRRECR